MTRIQERFNEIGERKALVTFITAGDPTLSHTVPAMHSMELGRPQFNARQHLHSMGGQPNHAVTTSKKPRNRLPNPPVHIGRQRIPTLWIELLNAVRKTDVALLHKVNHFGLIDPVTKLFRNRHHKPKVAIN